MNTRTQTIVLGIAGLISAGLFAAPIRAANYGATSSLKLLSGNINGQQVTPEHRKVVVAPGDLIAGKWEVSINSTWPSFCVMAIAVTPTWGEHSSSYLDLGHFGTPVADLRRTIDLHLTAPSEPGTYRIIAAFTATFTAGQVMSCTNWSVRRDVWNNGDDIAEWPAYIVDAANAAGTVEVPCLTPEGETPSYVPATAIEIVVSLTARRLGAGTTSNRERPAGATEWIGFENSPNKDREAQLHKQVGEFRRVTSEGDFLSLCRGVGEECVEVRDWEGRNFTCEQGSNPGHDGSRLALCKLPGPGSVARVSLGQTPDEVVAVLGAPKYVLEGGANTIYVYANFKVTFKAGKVSALQ